MNDFDVVTGSAPAKLIPPPPAAEKPRERAVSTTAPEPKDAVPRQQGAPLPP